MPDFLGIDTSNYTTSAAVYVSEEGRIYQAKRLLPVKEGALGLRQSDAVFHHTKQLPDIIGELYSQREFSPPVMVTASARPRNAEGSYMPCFLCGEGFARSYSAINGVPMTTTSHQVGHILAALYSTQRLDLINECFIAFHVSGGTTDCLLCEPDSEELIRITLIGTSLDLKAGQAVDRIGLMLGLKFPCGIQLEELALRSSSRFKIKPVMKGMDCCMSGLENLCRKMLDGGESRENTARYCLEYISETILSMTMSAAESFGELPLLYAGGVMSDSIIRDRIISVFPGACFAQPEYSCDNAAGVALYGYFKSKNGE